MLTKAAAGSSGKPSTLESKHMTAAERWGAYDEASTLSILLRNLLALDSMGVLFAESEVGDGDVVQHNIEVVSALCEDPADVATDHLHVGSFERPSRGLHVSPENSAAAMHSSLAHWQAMDKDAWWLGTPHAW